MHFDHPVQGKTNFSALSICVLLILAACAANAAGPRQANLPEVQLKIGKYTVQAEIADTDNSRRIGLMNRSNLEMDSGMLFVFSRSETQCMWMKNTLIDLDVAFADNYGRILNIEQMKAGTSDIHCSNGNAKFALEMNLDWFKNRQILEGEQLHIPSNLKPQ
jgi:uncharacterized protein